MERAKVIFRPVQVPSISEQYRDLALYFEELGETELAEFYKELSLVEGK